MRNRFVLVLVDAALALAQPSAILEDLEQRAVAAISRIDRSLSWDGALKAQPLIRTRIEQSLNLNRPLPVASSAFLYEPMKAAAAAPAVILVRPHQDRTLPEFVRLPAAIARMGMLVLELDTEPHHSRLDLLADGLLPQSLIQQDFKIALGYLKARSDVDTKRLAIVGDGLVATVAAGINSDLAAAVLLEGAPDFRLVIKDLRSLASDRLLDSCILLPGIVQYAAAEELVSLIAPRPLLLISAAAGVLEYAADVYRSSGQREHLAHVNERGWTAAARHATCAWLARSLQGRPDISDLGEPDVLPRPSRLELRAPPRKEAPPGIRLAVSEQSLTSAFGVPLPEGPMGYGLNCHRSQQVGLYPQAGIRIPLTVMRPGPGGCDPAFGTLIAIDDRGRASLATDEIVQEAVRRGWMVWAPDPRCIGELKTSSEPFVFAVSLLLGENLTWRQAADIIRVLRHVGGANSRYPSVLYARGATAGIAASYVAAIADRNELEWIVLRDVVSTFRDLTDIAPWAVPFDVLKSFDIVDMWKAAKGRLLIIHRAEEFLDRQW